MDIIQDKNLKLDSETRLACLSDLTVLITGQTGSGKSTLAEWIHAQSHRRGKPFVTIHIASLNENLVESELFGHEKGAFTGAQGRKIGKFELAHGGTILLDEISEMELALQAKLLRVLQEREVDRVGGKEPIPVDVRVVATTNRRLEESVRAGEFRSDLYYRLNVIPLTLPPLRDRKSDIKLLAEHFMRQYLGKNSTSLTEEVLETLMKHNWPGNIRELQNAIERAAILSRGETFRESDFLLGTNSEGFTPAVNQALIPENDTLRVSSGTTVQEMEKKLILETLKATDNNRTQAAKLLGVSIRTLRNKLNEYNDSQ